MPSTHIHKTTHFKVFLVSLMTLFCYFAWADEGYFLPLSSGTYADATDLAAADFNGDSNEDMVMVFGVAAVAVAPVSTPVFYLQNAAGIFIMEQSGPQVIGSRVAAADFNNDSNIDLVITGGDMADSLVFPSNTAVYFNSGDWSTGSGFDFASPLTLGGLHYAPELAVGDYDDDGDVDIILGVTEPNGSGSIVIWVNQGFAQGGTVGTFQSITYFENSGPYNEITALSLGQVSLADDTLDLVFARSNTNQVQVALNDGLGGFATTTTAITVNATAVNDVQMVAADYLAVANSGATSRVYQVMRNGSGVPTGYDVFREIGTALQVSEKIIPMNLGNQPAFFLSSDFDGSNSSSVTSLAFYGFTLFGANTQLGVVPQCLLSGLAPAQGAVSLAGNGSGFDDLMLLTRQDQLYQIINNASQSILQCCMTESQFIAVSEPGSSPSINPSGNNLDLAGISQAGLWLDSLIKLRDVRNNLMSLTAAGQRYVNHYINHEVQLVQLLASDAQMANAWGQVISSWNGPIAALLNGTDDQYILTAQQMSNLSNFLTLLQNQPGVGSTVTNELALIQPLMSYVGGTMRDFNEDTIAVVSSIIFKDGFE